VETTDAYCVKRHARKTARGSAWNGVPWTKRHRWNAYGGTRAGTEHPASALPDPTSVRPSQRSSSVGLKSAPATVS